jgi:hypothetical protein
MAVALDTLQYARKLRAAGVPEAQAEAHAEALAAVVGAGVVTREDLAPLATKADLERFATKADLERFVPKDEFEARISTLATKVDIQRLEAAVARCATREELLQLEQRMMLRFGAMFTVGFGLLAALLKLS